MSKAEPQVQKFMTTMPYSIDKTATIKEAESRMKELDIRHLPVMADDKIVGILSDRDIKTVCSLKGVDPSEMFVSDIYHDDPYVVEPETHLSSVAHEMAAHHYGCAIVIQNEKLVGIFTTVDMCRAMATLLEQRQHIQH